MRISPSPRPLNDALYREACQRGLPGSLSQWLARSSAALKSDSLNHFLQKPESELHDPFLLPDMDKAVLRTMRAIEHRELVLIHGDFDVDGLSAASVLYWGLRKASRETRPRVVLPHRFQGGHGLSLEQIEPHIQDGVRLVITADCGLGSAAEIQALDQRGVDVIITDHHLPEDQIAEACAVVHPRSACYPFSGLAGVGVAYKFIEALLRRMYGPESEVLHTTLMNLIDYVAMGTIADVMPLQGENRVLVARGLEHMMHSRLPFLKDFWMRRILKLELGESFNEDHVGFFMAPRLNSASRLESAWPAFRFLTATQPEQVAGFGEKLESLNQERSRRFRSLKESGDLEVHTSAGSPLVLIHTHSSELGLLGLIASSFAQQESGCAIAFGFSPDGLLAGSARASADYSLKRLLQPVESLLVGFGGHHQAAGMRLQPGAFHELAQALLKVEPEFYCHSSTETARGYDAQIAVSTANVEFIEQMQAMGPFGEGNPRPLFALSEYTLVRSRRVGRENRDLSLTLRGSGGAILNGIGFGLAGMQPEMEEKRTPIAGYLSFNYFGGRRVQFQLQGFADVF